MRITRSLKTSALITIVSFLGAFTTSTAVSAGNSVMPPVGFSMSWTVTQSSPGPQNVVITLSRPTADEILVSASTGAFSPDACVLGLGGSFNVQVSLKPKSPAIAGQYIVMQSIGSASYFVADGSGRHTGPSMGLSTIGVTLSFLGAANFAGDCSSGGGPGTFAEVSYTIPFGTGAGEFSVIRFLGTQPFGYNFEPPTDLTLIAPT